MSAPDFREWFGLDAANPLHDFFRTEMRPVVARWEREGGAPVFLRLTHVNSEWICLDGWRAPAGCGPDDQGPAPTEADIPVGFV